VLRENVTSPGGTTVAALRTEHVCRVFDVARTDQGEPYIVMELLHGNDVAQLLRREPLAPPIAVDFILQALLALAPAFAQSPPPAEDAGQSPQSPAPPALSRECQTPGVRISGDLPLPSVTQALRRNPRPLNESAGFALRRPACIAITCVFA